MAAKTGISRSTVHRWLQTFSLQPHRQKSHRYAEAFGYKLSIDPFFVETVRDIVGLYLNPPTSRWCSASTRRLRSRPWTARRSTPRSGPGWHSDAASTCTKPPTPPGSIRGSAGLGSSPSRRSAEAATPV
ncbi:hypothetical protein KBY74_09915 [Cyanobium sp. A1C-AMD]|uniref:hypothetical protein n=1 Tax=Cyanobium sp. A1C-AMD TaxID=2823694 RepID=UPI0037BE65FC|nr:hypothetical protein [Cyanobium sp. A1C-AMD]